MRVALLQMDARVGDFRGIRERVRGALEEAGDADLLILPELALTGYPPRDLLRRSAFLEAEERLLAEMAGWTERGPAILAGCTRPCAGGGGPPLHNAAVLLDGGRIAGEAFKTLLPTYDVFDEARYFSPAPTRSPLLFRSRRLGVTICEDLWTTEGFAPPGGYAVDPAAELAANGAEILINLSSSPFQLGKPKLRLALLSSRARETGLPLIYVNQVGGQDELIFDGGSCAFDRDGVLEARAASFREDLLVLELDRGLDPVGGRIVAPPDPGPAEACAALELGLRDYLGKCGFDEVVLGLSGGIDSALTAAIAVRALGPDRVTGVAMPSVYSSEGSLRDARALSAKLGIVLHEAPIRGIVGAYNATLEPVLGRPPEGVTEENLQARIRGDLVMALSNATGAMVLTTGNKSELAVGYCTLYGDMSGGLALLSDVPKTLVYRIAEWINREGEVIPRASIEKPPSAELRPGQRDEDSLPPYEVLDDILEAYVEEGLALPDIVGRGHPRETVEAVLRLVNRNEYKRRQAAPGLKITSKAFGVGRRYPVAADYSSLVEDREG